MTISKGENYMVNKYRCPACRDTVYLRRYLDGKFYVWDQTRDEEHKENGEPWKDREELDEMYAKHKKGRLLRKINWIAESLGL